MSDQKQKLEKLIEDAKSKRFGARALAILTHAVDCPQNPYDFFGKSMSRSHAYDYFARLVSHGFLTQVVTPTGRRGHHWYETNI